MGLWLTINLEQFDNIGQSDGEAGIRVRLHYYFLYFMAMDVAVMIITDHVACCL